MVRIRFGGGQVRRSLTGGARSSRRSSRHSLWRSWDSSFVVVNAVANSAVPNGARRTNCPSHEKRDTRVQTVSVGWGHPSVKLRLGTVWGGIVGIDRNIDAHIGGSESGVIIIDGVATPAASGLNVDSKGGPCAFCIGCWPDHAKRDWQRVHAPSSGCSAFWGRATGGVASLNPRRPSVIPPGSGTRDERTNRGWKLHRPGLFGDRVA